MSVSVHLSNRFIAGRGVIEEAMELALTIKTVRENYSAIEELIVSLHPYDVPEIVAVELDNGLKPYLDWLSLKQSSKWQVPGLVRPD